MAENLNVPSHFMPSKAKEQKPVLDLLPPSAFEGQKANDPWKELAKATGEVIQLQLENKKLREDQKNIPPLVIPAAPPPQEPLKKEDIHVYPSRKEDLKYIDELINKQAAEISDLKNDLRTLKCNQKEELTELERQMTLKEREYVHKIASLEGELRASEDRYEAQVDKLSREHQRETEELTDIVERLTQELSNVKTRSGSRIQDLERIAEETKTNLTSTINELQEELRSKESVLEGQSKQISQLKRYIGETENVPQPADVWRKEKEALEKKLKAYESEKENLQSTVQLLNIRLTSTNEILKLQETEISKTPPEMIEKVKKEGLLLTRWREKVFALMVQQKSADILAMKNDQNWKEKVFDLEKKLSSAQNQVEQLTHAVSDRTAELDLERNTNMRLQQELSEAQQLALRLDDSLMSNRQSAEILQSFADSINCQVQEKYEHFQSSLATLKTYGQRITFASSRVEMLQGLFARREALLKLQKQEGVEDLPLAVADRAEVFQMDREDGAYLQSELERVMRERDNLATQIREDAQMWQEKTQTIKSQYEEELSSLKQTVEDLELVLQEKSQKCIELSERLERAQEDVEESAETIEELKTNLAKQQIGLDKTLEEQKREAELQCAEQFAEMDRKLNDAKREHTKAVVSLRQLERQTAREKERATEHLKTVEEHYTRQNEKLLEQLRSVEKERNLMMATLRQEGLIGKLKTDRAEPIRVDWNQEERLHTDKGESHSDRSEPHSARSGPHSESNEPHAYRSEPHSDRSGPPHDRSGFLSDRDEGSRTEALPIEQQSVVEDEPLTAVLEDLQSLTDAVLKDDGSESGSDADT